MASFYTDVDPESIRPAESPRARGRSSVWIVDDSVIQGQAYRDALAPDYDVMLFANGPVALEALVTGKGPDVLVVDWYMPDFSGVEMCRCVRGTLNLAQLPIIVVTAVGTSDDLLEALAAGANDFVKKPVTALELNARVAGLVQVAHLHASLTEAERKLRIEAVFRERFIAMLAHDLRQPLSTIAAGCEVLSQPGATENIPSVVARQLRAAERMRRMVTDLLDLTSSRPDRGLPIQRRWTDFAALSQLSLAEIAAAHPDQEIHLSVSGKCEGHWDPDRLAQILSNLVGNAIEHGSPQGRVAVTLTAKADAVELRVCNRGPAISKEVLSTLGQPFRHLRDVRRSSRGLGLGLHIVHEIVRAHGGTLTGASEDGETYFLVSLPPEHRPAAEAAD